MCHPAQLTTKTSAHATPTWWVPRAPPSVHKHWMVDKHWHCLSVVHLSKTKQKSILSEGWEGAVCKAWKQTPPIFSVAAHQIDCLFAQCDSIRSRHLQWWAGRRTKRTSYGLHFDVQISTGERWINVLNFVMLWRTKSLIETMNQTKHNTLPFCSCLLKVANISRRVSICHKHIMHHLEPRTGEL